MTKKQEPADVDATEIEDILPGIPEAVMDPAVVEAARFYMATQLAEQEVARNHQAANRRMERHHLKENKAKGGWGG